MGLEDPLEKEIFQYFLLTPIFLPEESHEQRRLVGYSPWAGKKSDATDTHTHTHTHVITHPYMSSEKARIPATPLFKCGQCLGRRGFLIKLLYTMLRVGFTWKVRSGKLLVRS